MSKITDKNRLKKQNHQPGTEAAMHPAPEYIKSSYKAAGKLKGKVALVTEAATAVSAVP